MMALSVTYLSLNFFSNGDGIIYQIIFISVNKYDIEHNKQTNKSSQVLDPYRIVPTTHNKSGRMELINLEF